MLKILKKHILLEVVFGVWRKHLKKLMVSIEVISGYSGGNTKNPTYKEVTYGKTGHFEAIEIKYD